MITPMSKLENAAWNLYMASNSSTAKIRGRTLSQTESRAQDPFLLYIEHSKYL